MNEESINLLHALVQLGVKRQEIAEYLRCDRGQIDRYFCGSRNPSTARCLLLEQLLKAKQQAV